MVMSESSRARSSASTWMLTRNVDWPVGAHSTSSSRSGWLEQARRRWCSRLRCTETPPPLVTKPRIASGRHRRAALGELDPDVGDALDDDAGVAAGADACERPRRPVIVTASARSSCGAVVAAVQVDDPAYDGLGAEVALADRGVERGDVGEVEVLGDQRQRLVGEQPLERQALLAHQLGDLVLALLDRLLAPLLGEPLPDLGAGPRRLARSSASRATGRRSATLEVKTSTTSPLSSVDSSGTSRPLTRAPIVWCPTSVWTA